MKSVFATIFAITATIVSAQVNIVSITSPLTGTIYTAGESAKISWINAKVDVVPKIVLAKGDPNALTIITTIAENVDANAGTYTWNIPSDIEAGEDYAFELGTSPNLSFTGLFTIKAATNNTTASESSSVSASSTASASSTSCTKTSSTKSAASSTVSSAASSVTSAMTSAASSSPVSSSTSAASSAVSSSASAAPSAVSSIASAASSVASAASSAASSIASSATASASTTPTAAAGQNSANSAGVKMTSNKAALGAIAIAGAAAAALI